MPKKWALDTKKKIDFTIIFYDKHPYHLDPLKPSLKLHSIIFYYIKKLMALKKSSLISMPLRMNWMSEWMEELKIILLTSMRNAKNHLDQMKANHQRKLAVGYCLAIYIALETEQETNSHR